MGRLLQLAVTFFQIGLFSIGGGYAIIPLIQEQVVERFAWVSQKTFTDIITISQMTPGHLAVNTSTFIGIQIAGIPGAVLATFGCVISGISISAFLYRLFQRYHKSEYIMEILNGLKAASLGLIISAALTILLLSFTGTSVISEIKTADWTAAVIFLCSFFVLRKWKANPVAVMIGTGIVGGVIYTLF